jgi:hypothetical protein
MTRVYCNANPPFCDGLYMLHLDILFWDSRTLQHHVNGNELVIGHLRAPAEPHSPTVQAALSR